MPINVYKLPDKRIIMVLLKIRWFMWFVWSIVVLKELMLRSRFNIEYVFLLITYGVKLNI